MFLGRRRKTKLAAHVLGYAFNFIAAQLLGGAARFVCVGVGEGEELREDVEGVEDPQRGKRGRGAKRSTITAVVCTTGGAVT